MTSADFAAKYKLLKRITEGGVRSYNAQQGSSGRPVMVHFLDGMSGSNQALFVSLNRLDAPDRSKIIESIDVDGTPVVVTQFLPGFTSLETWIEARVPSFRAHPISPGAQATPTIAPPVVGPSAPPHQSKASTSVIDSLPPSDPSFSSIWKAAQAPETPAAPPPPPARVAPPSPPAPPTDEFSAPTQLMSVPTLPPPPAEASPPASPTASRADRNVEAARLADAIERLEPGEFTRMFMAPESAGAPSASALPRLPPPPAGLSPAAPPPAARPPVVPARAAPSTPPEPPVPASPPLPRSEPGEFTRLFQSPSASPRDESPLFGSPPGAPPVVPPQAPFGPPPALPEHQRVAPTSLPADASRVFEVPIPPVAPARELPSDRIVPASGYDSPPQSVTGMLAARHAEPPPPQLPTDLFGFGSSPAAAPGTPAPEVLGGSPSFAIPPLAPPAGGPRVPAVPGFPVPAPPPLIPPAAVPPILAAPSIAAAAGAAITFGAAAGSAPPPPGAPPGAGPSEFTRVLKGVAAPAAIGAAVTAGAIVAQKKKDQKAGRAGPSIVPLVIGLNLVLVAAIALILYFVLRG